MKTNRFVIRNYKNISHIRLKFTAENTGDNKKNFDKVRKI